MQKVDFDKHAEYVLNLPRYKGGFEFPIVIHEKFAKKIIQAGEWDKYKNMVVVSKNLKEK